MPLPAKLDAVQRRAVAVRHPAVRDTLADYMRKTRRAIESLRALVVHLERTPSKQPDRGLLREIEAANEEMLSADAKLLGRVLDETSPLLRDRVREIVPAQ